MGPTVRATVQGAQEQGITLTWTTPTVIEIGIGLEINGYLPAAF
jgi:coenzyme PQQ precursor peptide PqqA